MSRLNRETGIHGKKQKTQDKLQFKHEPIDNVHSVYKCWEPVE